MSCTCVKYCCADIITKREVPYKCADFAKEVKEMGDAMSVSLTTAESEESLNRKKAGETYNNARANNYTVSKTMHARISTVKE